MGIKPIFAPFETQKKNLTKTEAKSTCSIYLCATEALLRQVRMMGCNQLKTYSYLNVSFQSTLGSPHTHVIWFSTRVPNYLRLQLLGHVFLNWESHTGRLQWYQFEISFNWSCAIIFADRKIFQLHGCTSNLCFKLFLFSSSSWTKSVKIGLIPMFSVFPARGVT